MQWLVLAAVLLWSVQAHGETSKKPISFFESLDHVWIYDARFTLDSTMRSQQVGEMICSRIEVTELNGEAVRERPTWKCHDRKTNQMTMCNHVSSCMKTMNECSFVTRVVDETLHEMYFNHLHENDTIMCSLFEKKLPWKCISTVSKRELEHDDEDGEYHVRCPLCRGIGDRFSYVLDSSCTLQRVWRADTKNPWSIAEKQEKQPESKTILLESIVTIILFAIVLYLIINCIQFHRKANQRLD